MTTAKPKKAPTLNLQDDERFPKIREVFERRGLRQLSLSAMVRILIDEWLKNQSGRA